jgi:hypothetical protein
MPKEKSSLIVQSGRLLAGVREILLISGVISAKSTMKRSREMGELADDFNELKKAKLEHRAEVEPSRTEYAIKQLKEKGHVVRVSDEQLLVVNGYIKFWPFTGWFSGKGIGSGRGIRNLIKKLEEKKS